MPKRQRKRLTEKQKQALALWQKDPDLTCKQVGDAVGLSDEAVRKWRTTNKLFIRSYAELSRRYNEDVQPLVVSAAYQIQEYGLGELRSRLKDPEVRGEMKVSEIAAAIKVAADVISNEKPRTTEINELTIIQELSQEEINRRAREILGLDKQDQTESHQGEGGSGDTEEGGAGRLRGLPPPLPGNGEL